MRDISGASHPAPPREGGSLASWKHHLGAATLDSFFTDLSETELGRRQLKQDSSHAPQIQVRSEPKTGQSTLYSAQLGPTHAISRRYR